MGFLLAPIALFLFALVGTVHSVVTLLTNISRRAFFKTTSQVKFQLAFDIDVFGNYLFRETWKFLFVKKNLHKVYLSYAVCTPKTFGVFGETISSALGRGRRDGWLSFFGWLFSWLLDIIWFTDWFKGGHCKASIMTDQRIHEIRKSFK